MPSQCSFSMLRTIGRFGITLSVASTLGVASLGTHPVLARARAIAQSSSRILQVKAVGVGLLTSYGSLNTVVHKEVF
jgi:hypothetical protein